MHPLVFLHFALLAAYVSCRSVQGVNISLAGYSILKSEEEAKDALVNHGAVSISIYAGTDFQSWSAYGQQLVAARSDLLSGRAQGVTCFNTTGTNHAVNLVGWTPCMVRH